mgnify:CR=1
MTIKELYEWAKENKGENLPVSVRYWNILNEEYSFEEIHLSDLEADSTEIIICID